MLKKYKISLLSVFIFVLLPYSKIVANSNYDLRNDSLDIFHYSIHLDLSDLKSKTLKGNCKISAYSKIKHLSGFALELYKLKVDSVLYQEKKIGYFYNDSILVPQFSQAFGINDSFEITVYYQGKPFVDPSGFGGFIFNDANGGIAYNLGIGFSAIPHNMGRTWFPCIDDFIDKAAFSFFITTAKNHKAFCGGLLVDSLPLASDKIRWQYELTQEIPAYLVSVAVSDFATYHDSYKSISGAEIPIEIAAYRIDSSKVSSSFGGLKECVRAFEELFGPYPFNKIGYFEMPTQGGAMEHATNIAYPKFAFSQNVINLWSHELSHHWWGNYMTCMNIHEMWLNEGWASYCEGLFYEKVFGKESYKENNQRNHAMSLKYTHLADNGYRAISPIPAEYAYGRHVYVKGADVIHTLRNQMGDSLFFKGIKYFLEKYAWKNASSDDFKRAMEESSKLSLDDFFNTFIYTPGFVHVEISKVKVEKNGSNYDCNIDLIQRTKGGGKIYDELKVMITCFDEKWNKIQIPVVMGESKSIKVTLNIEPVFIHANIDQEINDASIQNYKVIKDVGSIGFSESGINYIVDKIQDSALVYIGYHLMPAIRTENSPKNIRISSDRYWTIDGIFPANYEAHAIVVYDGRTDVNFYSAGYLDNGLIDGTEDSLVLMYRQNPWDDWQEYGNYSKTMGNKSDKFGNIRIENIKSGQYTLGMIDYKASVNSTDKRTNFIRVYPNPATNSINISLENKVIPNGIQLFDMTGKSVYKSQNPKKASLYEISTAKLNKGYYLLKIETANTIYTEKILISH